MNNSDTVRTKEQMNAITKTTTVAVLVALGLALAAEAAEPLPYGHKDPVPEQARYGAEGFVPTSEQPPAPTGQSAPPIDTLDAAIRGHPSRASQPDHAQLAAVSDGARRVRGPAKQRDLQRARRGRRYTDVVSWNCYNFRSCARCEEMRAATA